MGKTLYDILEVSKNASPESIRAAYERLSEKFSDSSAIPDAKLQATAVTEAFLTLSAPAKRAVYDQTLTARAQPVTYKLEAVEPFWTLPKFLLLLALVAASGGAYYKHNREQARLETERVIAIAKAKEAEAKAKMEAEQQQFELQKQREQALQEERQRRERDAAFQRFDFQQRGNRIENVMSDRSKEQRERMAMQQRQREEAAAAAAVRQRLAQEKAELCRLERERYGRAISCY
jgi:curved DNA-binding protein CbpA